MYAAFEDTFSSEATGRIGSQLDRDKAWRDEGTCGAEKLMAGPTEME